MTVEATSFVEHVKPPKADYKLPCVLQFGQGSHYIILATEFAGEKEVWGTVLNNTNNWGHPFGHHGKFSREGFVPSHHIVTITNK